MQELGYIFNIYVLNSYVSIWNWFIVLDVINYFKVIYHFESFILRFLYLSF